MPGCQHFGWTPARKRGSVAATFRGVMAHNGHRAHPRHTYHRHPGSLACFDGHLALPESRSSRPGKAALRLFRSAKRTQDQGSGSRLPQTSQSNFCRTNPRLRPQRENQNPPNEPDSLAEVPEIQFLPNRPENPRLHPQLPGSQNSIFAKRTRHPDARAPADPAPTPPPAIIIKPPVIPAIATGLPV